MCLQAFSIGVTHFKQEVGASEGLSHSPGSQLAMAGSASNIESETLAGCASTLL